MAVNHLVLGSSPSAGAIFFVKNGKKRYKMKIILFISLAGALGTLVRYLSVKAVNSVVPDSFRATLAVNIAGAFLAGFCFVLCKAKLSTYQNFSLF